MLRKYPLVVFASLAVATVVSPACGGEFVTWQQDFRDPNSKEVLPQRAVPYCSSKLGCWLSGVDLPDAAEVGAQGQGAPDKAPATPAPPVVAASHLPDAHRHVANARPKPKPDDSPVVIAASETEAPLLVRLRAIAPAAHVRIVKAETGTSGADLALQPEIEAAPSADHVKLVPETLYIVARDDIHAIGDLRGKPVSFGMANSSSQNVARAAFQAAAVAPTEVPLDFDNALDGLATGDIEAVAVLAPGAAAPLAKIANTHLHLVAWPAGAVPNGARLTDVASTVYPGLSQAEAKVAVIQVDSVLEMTAQGEHRPAAKSFLAALAQKRDALAKLGFAQAQPRPIAGAPTNRLAAR